MAEKEDQLLTKYGKKFTRSQVIFREGELGDKMYIIQSGKVKVSKRIGDVEKTLAILEKGEFFGEMALLNNKPRSATIEVIEDGSILEIDKKTFETMIRNNVEIALRMIKKMSSRLQEADKQIEILLVQDEYQRVILYLKRLIHEVGIETRDWIRLEYEYSPIDFAGRVGISVSNVGKIIDALIKGAFISIRDGKLVITNKQRFQDLLKYMELKDRFSDFVP